jgi:hypothetical protein
MKEYKVEIPLREKAWLLVAKSLYDKLPEYVKDNLQNNVQVPSELSKLDKASAAILKLVEIEAFNLERNLKNLGTLEEPELKQLYMNEILWGSLMSVIKDESVEFQAPTAIERLRHHIAMWCANHPPTYVHVSPTFFHQLIEQMLIRDPEAPGEIKQMFIYAMANKDYQNLSLTVDRCIIMCQPELSGDTIQFVLLNEGDGQ